MKAKLLITICFITVFQFGYCQSWNVRDLNLISQNRSVFLSNGIVDNNENIYLGGDGLFVKIDNKGDTLWTKNFIYDSYRIKFEKELFTKDSNIIAFGDLTCTNVNCNDNDIGVTKFDRNGKVIKNKILGFDSIVNFYEAIKLSENEYIILGNLIDSSSNILVAKIDSNLNMIWSASYKIINPTYFKIAGDKINDSTIVIGISDNTILKLNTNSKAIYNIKKEFSTSLIDLKYKSNYLYIYGIQLDFNGGYRIIITKLDSNFNFINSKSWASERYEFSTLQFINDSIFYVSSSTYCEGSIVNFWDTNLNSKFVKGAYATLYLIPYKNIIYVLGYPGCLMGKPYPPVPKEQVIIYKSDSSYKFVCSSFILQSPTINETLNYQNSTNINQGINVICTIINDSMKLNNIFKYQYVEACGIGGGINSLNINHTLLLSPNPAHNTLDLQANNIVFKNISITNILGKEILYTNNSNTQSINIQSLNTGLYIIKATDMQGANYTAKFVKE